MRGMHGRTPALVLLGTLSATMLVGVGAATAQEAGIRVGANTVLESAGGQVGYDDPDTAVRGSDIVGLAVDPADPAHIVETDQDFINGLCNYHVTFDGGQSWSDGTLPWPPKFASPPCVRFDAGGYAHTGGSVAFGADNHVYTVYSSVRGEQGDSIVLATSTDGGRVFGTAKVAIPGGAAGDPVHQRPKVAVEARPGGDRVYVAAWRGAVLPEDAEVPACGGPCGYEIVVAVSEDGGQTFGKAEVVTSLKNKKQLMQEAPVGVAREPSAPVVAPDGTVYEAWRDRFDTDTSEDRIGFASSTDGGKTWTNSYVGGAASRVVGLRQPRLAVDADGRLYVSYQASPSDDNDVFLQSSDDGGATWSDPVRVNDDEQANGVDQLMPRVVVAPGGRVDMTWYDQRNDGPGPDSMVDVYFATSTDQGQTFSPNQRVTDRSINTDMGLYGRVLTAFFYSPAMVPTGDNTALIAWGDPRMGNVTNSTSDVFLARVDAAASGAVPVQVMQGGSTDELAVLASQAAYPGGRTLVGDDSGAQVVIVPDGDVGAALAGGVLARQSAGPVLVGGENGLSTVTQDEIARLQPAGVILVGDDTALPEAVLSDLADAGIGQENVERLNGESAAETASVVGDRILQVLTTRAKADADEDNPFEQPVIEQAVIVNPDAADAASAGVLAAGRQLPVLFVGADAIPEATSSALESWGVTSTIVVGGAESVSDAVVSDLPDATRVAGDDIAGTSAAVAAQARDQGMATNLVYAVESDAPMDAAVLGSSIGRAGGLVLQVPDLADTGSIESTIGAMQLGSGVDRIVLASASGPSSAPTDSSSTNWIYAWIAGGVFLLGLLTFVVARRRRGGGAAPATA